uniref:Uncharacterized protein n=1 Tax=Brassica campestris TaxID=3711 RepID=A0A3P6ABP1_BRACM|nr:unnamed protein product [Brassica rapa]
MQSKIGGGGLPPAFSLFPSLNKTFTFHQILVPIITFLAYASFHASRKPPSIVKSVLGHSVNEQSNSPIDNRWAPFKGTKGTQRLGELDLAFLSSYAPKYVFRRAFRRYDRSEAVFRVWDDGKWDPHRCLRVRVLDERHLRVLHDYSDRLWVVSIYRVALCCLVFANWCGKEKRGLIMGVWNSHTYVGKIVGSFVASSVLDSGWGWSFALPGGLVIVSGLVVRIISDLNLATSI